MIEYIIYLLRFGLLFFFILSPNNLIIEECKQNIETIQRGKMCWANIDDLKPSQFSLGYWEVEKAIESLQSVSYNEIYNIKLQKKVPCNIAPNGDIYMYNKHHSIRAFNTYLKDNDKWVFVIIDQNYYNLESMNDFYRKLIVNNKVRLMDAKGIGPLDPILLPKHISELQNDPFRSLAAITRTYGCWKDESTPFVEFIWADYYRIKLQFKFKTLQISRSDSKEWCNVRPYSTLCIYNEKDLLESLILDALDHCTSQEARFLPGFKGK